jgi:hypothetical protein
VAPIQRSLALTRRPASARRARIRAHMMAASSSLVGHMSATDLRSSRCHSGWAPGLAQSGTIAMSN